MAASPSQQHDIGRKAASTAVFAVLLATALPSGCASREYRREDFARDRERCVGLTFGAPASWWCGWDQAVASVNVDETTVEYEIAPPDMGDCRWVYRVDRTQQVVVGWRYLQGAEDCVTPIDWLGAW